MARTELVKVRVDTAEKALWSQAAEAAGLELSTWVRRACGEQAALEGALAREEERLDEEVVGRAVVAGAPGPVSRLFERRG
jgi:antitoxin component of RelBE/YafQ-DinJ toxin-antitoxin module